MKEVSILKFLQNSFFFLISQNSYENNCSEVSDLEPVKLQYLDWEETLLQVFSHEFAKFCRTPF